MYEGFKIFVFEVVGFDTDVKIAKRTKEDAIRWFHETYPTRGYTDIYEF